MMTIMTIMMIMMITMMTIERTERFCTAFAVQNFFEKRCFPTPLFMASLRILFIQRKNNPIKRKGETL